MKYGFYGRIHKGICEDCPPSSQDNKEMGDAPSRICALPRQTGKGREAWQQRKRYPTPGAEPAGELRRRLRPWRLSAATGTTVQPRPMGLPRGRTEPGCAEAGPPKPKRDAGRAATATKMRLSTERWTGSSHSASTSHVRARDKPPPRKSTGCRRKKRSGRAWGGGARSSCRGVSRRAGAGPCRSETDYGSGVLVLYDTIFSRTVIYSDIFSNSFKTRSD